MKNGPVSSIHTSPPPSLGLSRSCCHRGGQAISTRPTCWEPRSLTFTSHHSQREEQLLAAPPRTNFLALSSPLAIQIKLAINCQSRFIKYSNTPLKLTPLTVLFRGSCLEDYSFHDVITTTPKPPIAFHRQAC